MADYKEFNRKMDKTLEVLNSDFDAVRAGRANAKVLDRITVPYYGTETPLSQVAAIAYPLKRPSRPPNWASTPRTTAV